MNTSELILRMNDYALDEELDNEDEELYLRCLNTGYCKLYNGCASGMYNLMVEKYIFFDQLHNCYNLPDDFFQLKAIEGDNGILEVFEGLSISKQFGNNQYIRSNNTIILKKPTSLIKPNPDNNNIPTSALCIKYLPLPKKLVKIITNPNTETDTPIFKDNFHYMVVLAGLRELYVAQRMYFEKWQALSSDWQSGLDKMGYFKNYGN